MRVALIAYGRLDQRTGGYLYDRLLAEALGRRGVAVEPIALPTAGYAGRLAQNCAFDLRGLIEGGGFDLVLEDELVHPSLVLGGALNPVPPGGPRARRARRVAIVHNLGAAALPRGLVRCAARAIEAGYLAGVDGMVLNSHHTRAEVARVRARMPPHVVAYPGVDHLAAPVAAPRRVQAGSTPTAGCAVARLLFVGNLSPVKGLHLLLPALAALTGQPWSLDLVGSLARDPGYSARIRRMIAELGLQDRIRFWGELSGAALSERFAAASIFVLPSPAEGFGIACLEAMASGLAVVASAYGAAPELITHGADGLLVDPRDARELAGALAALMRDPSRAARLGAAAARTAACWPTWDQCGARVHRLLEALADAAVDETLIPVGRRTRAGIRSEIER